MAKLISTFKSSLFIIVLLICLNTYADEYNKEQLLENVKQYQSLILENKFESAALKAAKAYQLSQVLFEPSSVNHITIEEDYALILLQIEQYKQAIPILQSLVETIEKKYSTHDERLIPLLGDLKLATKKIDLKLSKEYAIRQTQLYLRYNSNEYVEGLKNKDLTSTQQAKNLADDLTKITKNKYKIMDAGQWDLIYNEDSDFNFKQLVKQMDKSYNSALGFLISFNILSKLPEEKLKAVFFSSRKDYVAYFKSKKRLYLTQVAEQSSGIYSKRLNTLFLFDRQLKNNKKNKFNVFSGLRHEIGLQAFYSFGLLSRSGNTDYPLWRRAGLGGSIECHNFAKISGSQTQNYSFRRLSKLKEKIKKGTLMPLTQLIAIKRGSENIQNKHNADSFNLGTFLVRFLYEEKPDELRKYIKYLTKTHRTKLSKRSSTFYRYFGDREALQQSFDDYLATLIKKMDDKRAAYKRNKKNKTK